MYYFLSGRPITTISSSSVSPPASLQAADRQSCDDVTKDARDADEPGRLADCELPASDFVDAGGPEATLELEKAGSASSEGGKTFSSSVIVGFLGFWAWVEILCSVWSI